MEMIKVQITTSVSAAKAQRLGQIFETIAQEVVKAQKKFAPFNSPHEGYAIILEELDEMWDALKKNEYTEAELEVRQVAAMAVRYLYDLA